MAGQAIEAVQLEVLGKCGQANEALESGFAHLGDILEFHVIGDEGQDLRGVVIGETQPLANHGGHFHAHLDVAIEADAVSRGGGRAKCGRLADVVKENTPGQRGRGSGGEVREHQAGVNPNVALRMILGRLRYTFHSGDFRQELLEKAGIVQKLKAAACGAFREELGQFFTDAFGGDDVNFWGQLLNGREGGRFDGIVEASGKTNRPQHTQFVFIETAFGITDGADDPGLQIVLAAHVVEDLAGIVAHQQTVDGEVAAGHVFLGRFGVDHAIGMPAVGVTHIGAKGGDFDLACIARDKNDAELRADSHASREKMQDTVRSGVGGYVVISGLAIQEDIAHTATDEQRLVTVADQRVADRIGEFAGVHGLIMRQARRRANKN